MTVLAAGSGKTILFSSILNELKPRCATDKSARKGIGFHYCSLDNAASQPVNNVFGSVLAQIATVRPELVQYVQPMRKTGPQLIPKNNLTLFQIHQVMKFALDLFDCFYLLIDALNETPYDNVILATLISLCEKHSNLRVLVTSTREPNEESDLIRIRRMSEGGVNLDIETYVRQRLLTESSFRSLTPPSQSEARHTIVSGAQGV
jgi:hypothetical protein